MENSENNRPKILRLPQVKERTGLARATIYHKMKYEDFPQNFSLGGRSVGWLEAHIEAWILKCANNIAFSQRK